MMCRRHRPPDGRAGRISVVRGMDAPDLAHQGPESRRARRATEGHDEVDVRANLQWVEAQGLQEGPPRLHRVPLQAHLLSDGEVDHSFAPATPPKARGILP